jgi:hypothetical protein
MVDDPPDDESPRADDDNPETVSAVDPIQQGRKRRKAENEQEKAARFWRAVFGDETGRRAMWEILESVGWRNSPFTATAAGFPDPNATWFNAGRHAYAQHLFMTWLRVDHDGVMLMLAEHDPRFAVPKGKKR